MKTPRCIELPPEVDPDIFASPLDAPMPIPSPMAVALLAHGAPNGSEAVYAEFHKIESEMFMEHILLLAKRLGIETNDPNFCARLAIALAKAFVPGLRVLEHGRRRPGRPRVNDKIDLFRTVEEMVHANPGKGPSWACQRLVKNPGKWKGKNPRSLESKYYVIKSELGIIHTPDPILVRLKSARGESRKTNK